MKNGLFQFGQDLSDELLFMENQKFFFCVNMVLKMNVFHYFLAIFVRLSKRNFFGANFIKFGKLAILAVTNDYHIVIEVRQFQLYWVEFPITNLQNLQLFTDQCFTDVKKTFCSKFKDKDWFLRKATYIIICLSLK